MKLLVVALLFTVVCASPMLEALSRKIPIVKDSANNLNNVDSVHESDKHSEVNDLRSMKKTDMKPSKYFQNTKSEGTNQILADEPPFDAAEHWPQCADSINEVPVIGKCDASWAFSVVGAIRDRFCIKNSPVLPISAYDLVSCCEDCWEDGVNGCNGGDHHSAGRYFVNSGIVTGGVFRSDVGCKPWPYRDDTPKPNKTICHKSCSNEDYRIKYEDDKHYGYNQTVYNLRNIDVMKEIKENGPIVAEFKYYPDFDKYTGGIYKHQGKEKARGYKYAKVTGWGVDDKGESFWRAVGFQGKDWGLNGTFLISKGFNECEFESSMIGVTVLN